VHTAPSFYILSLTQCLIKLSFTEKGRVVGLPKEDRSRIQVSSMDQDSTTVEAEAEDRRTIHVDPEKVAPVKLDDC